MAAWFIVIGLVLCTMALLGSVVDRLPLSSALIYLIIGVLLGPGVSHWLAFRPSTDAPLLEVLFLVAVLVSLFTVGLKLRTPTGLFTRRLWGLPLRLAGPAMLVTIALVAVFANVVLGIEWAAAILLGAILAPTDPVLASDIQVHHENDRDIVRFGLSAEGGLNDATASPFVLLGLGLLGLHELGAGGWRWIAVDVVWSVISGFGIGWLCGIAVGAVVLVMRKRFDHAYGLEEFLGLGLIALSYGLADAAHALGFLAVLAAGLAMRRIETRSLAKHPGAEIRRKPLSESREKADLPPDAPTHLVGDVLDFNQRFESIGEVIAVLVLGTLLSAGYFSLEGAGLAVVLFVVVRPVSVFIGTLGSRTSTRHRRLLGWFGIRGVGSLYYLAFAIDQGLPEPLVDRFVPLVLTVIAMSIVVHGISATPMMASHERRARRKREAAQ
ncbi:MAG: cation:proton antiporter [Burkholderiaceae bacterium]